MRSIVLAVAFVWLAGSAVAEEAEIVGDSFDATVNVMSPVRTIEDTQDYYVDAKFTYFFRTIVHKKSKDRIDQVYVHVNYTGYDWRFFNSVSLYGGTMLKADRLRADVVRCGGANCRYEEEFVADLPEGYLELASKGGFQFKLNAQSGYEVLLSADAPMVQAQVRGAAKAIASLK